MANLSGVPAEAGRTTPRPDDTPGRADTSAVDRRVGEKVLVAFAALVTGAGVAWGAIYLLLGVPGAAAYPFAFSLVTLVNVLAFRRGRRFVAFAWIQILALLVVPLLLALHLGGFFASGAIPLWSSLAPIGAMLFLGPRAAVVALAGFAGVAAVSSWPGLGAASATPLPATAIGAFTVLNLVVVVAVAVAALRSFMDTHAELQEGQRKIRELEKAYLSQETQLRQQDRLATLGKLSAGVAHELNNPAAAARRSAQQLGAVLERLNPPADSRGAAREDALCLTAIRAAQGPGPADDPLDRSDRIDGLTAWLAARGATDAWELAEDLADAGLDEATLDAASDGFPDEAVIAALRWRADTGRARRLADEVGRSAQRMGEVVSALKGYSHMDGATRHDVDVVAGIEDTLIIMRGRLRDFEVRREIAPDVPPVPGNAGELNQVWTNLIDNAADAMGDGGTLTIRVAPTDDGVRVEIEDDGPGLPRDLESSAFDPFTTSKAPGEGSGMGLHLAHRTITERHDGTLSVDSRPGRTVFTVTLPAGPATDDDG